MATYIPTLFLLIEKIWWTLIYRHFKYKTSEIGQVQTMVQTQEKWVMEWGWGELFRTASSENSLPSPHSILRMCVFPKENPGFQAEP